MASAAKIDGDRAEKLTTCRQLSSDHDVYRADLRFVWRDRCEEAVLSVRAFLVGDWSVDTGNPDSHSRHGGNLHASGNSLRRQLVLLHLSPERHGADIQGLGRALPIALETLERAANQISFL